MTLRIMAVLMAFAAMSIAADQTGAKDKKQPPIKSAAPTKVQALTIPPHAVPIDANNFSYTDPQGKKWIYSKTPFGITRREDKPASPEDARNAQEERARFIESTKVVEDGDTIRFDQASPFGNNRWQKNKSDLNEMEKAAWEHELEKRAAPDNTAKASKD
jgi:hypothetical protein